MNNIFSSDVSGQRPKIKVSVIIPVYNVERYLSECLDSVLMQTLKDIEIICIDDGSTDNSAAILREYAERDTRFVLFFQTNKGLSATRNAGIQAAKGQYIYFLDSDDYIEPDTLEKVCKELDDKKLDIIYFDTYNFGDENIPEAFVEEKNQMYARNSNYPAIYPGQELLFEMLGNQDYLCAVWLQVISKNFLLRNNLWFYEGIIYEDELYTFQTMLLAERVAYIPARLHHRRLRQGSIITKPIDYQNVYGHFVYAKEAFPFLLKYGCKSEYLPRILNRVRSIAVGARNNFIRLTEAEKRKYKTLTEEEQFLFRLYIVDYCEMVKQKMEQTKKEVGSARKETERVKRVVELKEKHNADGLKRISLQEKKISKLERELKNVKSGWSFRIGRTVTWLPRKIKSGIRWLKTMPPPHT